MREGGREGGREGVMHRGELWSLRWEEATTACEQCGFALSYRLFLLHCKRALLDLLRVLHFF